MIEYDRSIPWSFSWVRLNSSTFSSRRLSPFDWVLQHRVSSYWSFLYWIQTEFFPDMVFLVVRSRLIGYNMADSNDNDKLIFNADLSLLLYIKVSRMILI